MPNENSEKSTFDEWALVELFGHQRIVGKVTEATIAGGAFIRVDVPNDDGTAVLFTRFFGPSAVYSMSPISREMALTLAKTQSAEPVKRYELPPALTAGHGETGNPERDTDRLEEEF